MGLSLLALAGEEKTDMSGVMAAALSAAGLIPELPPKIQTGLSPKVEDYCYGIRGLADYLGVSAPTAQKYVNDGILEPATRRVGRKYSFLKAKVDEIFGSNK